MAKKDWRNTKDPNTKSYMTGIGYPKELATCEQTRSGHAKLSFFGKPNEQRTISIYLETIVKTTSKSTKVCHTVMSACQTIFESITGSRPITDAAIQSAIAAAADTNSSEAVLEIMQSLYRHYTGPNPASHQFLLNFTIANLTSAEQALVESKLNQDCYTDDTPTEYYVFFVGALFAAVTIMSIFNVDFYSLFNRSDEQSLYQPPSGGKTN